MMVRPWPLLASEQVFDAGLFKVKKDRARSPRTEQECDFHVIHMADWLLVVPLTCDDRLVMVRQYRHGARRMGLEVPGGLLDAGGEQPEQGAARELAEETGYGGGEFVFLGELMPQPALLATRARFYLARDVEALAEPQPDPGEDLETVLVRPDELGPLIAAGDIHNAMTVTALALTRLAGHLGRF